MNFRITLLILTFLGFLSLFGQEEVTLPALPTPPAMEAPVVTPTTPESMIEEATKSMPEINEPSSSEETPTQELSEEPSVSQETSAPELSDEPKTNGLNTGLPAEVRQKVATILNKLLADEYVLYTKTLKYHWNVTGIVFHDFHAAFKEQYEKLFTIVDDTAERARALGAPALGSLAEFSAYARLKEITAEKLTPLEMVQQLLADHETVIRTIRSAIDETAALGDQGTSNFLQDLIIKHEKIAWMLRATAA